MEISKFTPCYFGRSNQAWMAEPVWLKRTPVWEFGTHVHHAEAPGWAFFAQSSILPNYV